MSPRSTIPRSTQPWPERMNLFSPSFWEMTVQGMALPIVALEGQDRQDGADDDTASEAHADDYQERAGRHRAPFLLRPRRCRAAK